MAEAGLVAYGAAIGVGLYLAVLAFSLRQRRPHGPEMEAQFIEPTENKLDTPDKVENVNLNYFLYCCTVVHLHLFCTTSVSCMIHL